MRSSGVTPEPLVWCALVCLLPACVDPSFVSLGSNASPTVASPGAAMTLDAGRTDAQPDGARDPDLPSAECELSTAQTALPEGTVCGDRQVVECVLTASPSADPLAPPALHDALAVIMRTCGERQNEMWIALDRGCATRFELNRPEPAAIACLSELLVMRRFACAEQVACAHIAVYDVPTSAVDPDWR